MDPRLINLYNEELSRLRGEAQDFSDQYPSEAGLLRLKEGQVADPYVERLLEGVAYLSARVRLKLDCQFPDFTQQLLEVLFPGWSAPVPSACIVQLDPLGDDPRLLTGAKVPRGTLVVGSVTDKRVEFETTADVELWPLRLSSTHYRSRAADLRPQAGLDGVAVKSAVRLELDLLSDELTVSALRLDSLRLFVACAEPQASQLLELMAGRCVALALSSDADCKRHVQWLSGDQVRHAGLDDAESLVDMPVRGHVAYRLFREYGALREKFNFCQISGLEAALARMPGRKFYIHLLMSADYPRLESSLKPDALKLFCTPAVSLRARSLERVDVVPGQSDYPLVVDRYRAQDQEVVQVLDVLAGGPGKEQRLSPLYEVASQGRLAAEGFYVLRRSRRLITEAEAERTRRWVQGGDPMQAANSVIDGAVRREDISAETFIALSERRSGTEPVETKYLTVKALCMDREGPRWLRAHPHEARYELQDSLPARKEVRCLVRPTEVVDPWLDGFEPWWALSLLSTNYTSLVDGGKRTGLQALRGLLSLFHRQDDHFLKSHSEALVKLDVQAVVRRMPSAAAPDHRLPQRGGASERHALCLAQGFLIKLQVSERGFEGGSPFVFGALLAAYLRGHAAINSFVETELSINGWLMPLRWAAQPGHRPGV